MVRDALYLLALLIIAYGIAGWYIVANRRKAKALQKREMNDRTVERLRDRYLAGDITLAAYEVGMARFEANMRKESE